MTQTESSIVDAWEQAATDLGIQFTAPFVVTFAGHCLLGLGLVHHFGGRVGAIISTIERPSAGVPDAVRSHYFSSQLSDSYTRYDRQFFIDTLNDWQFFGPDSEKPSWYTGKPWS